MFLFGTDGWMILCNAILTPRLVASTSDRALRGLRADPNPRAGRAPRSGRARRSRAAPPRTGEAAAPCRGTDASRTTQHPFLPPTHTLATVCAMDRRTLLSFDIILLMKISQFYISFVLSFYQSVQLGFAELFLVFTLSCQRYAVMSLDATSFHI